MFNTNRIFAYIIGLLFFVVGLNVALGLLNIPFSSVVLLLVGILTFCMYLKFNIAALKYIACFFVPTGLSYFIISAFHLTGVTNFLSIYLSLFIACLLVYLFSKKKIFLCVSLLIIMFILHTVTLSINNMKDFILEYDCFYMGVLATFLFIFEYKSFRYIPLWVAIIAYLGGVLSFLYKLKIVTPLIFKTLISITFLFIGIFIILYNYIKSKKQ